MQEVSSNFGFLTSQSSGRTKSGQNVNVDSVLTEPTTMSCINIISEGITQLPYYVASKNDDGVYERNEGHPMTMLLNRPNVFQSATDFKGSIVSTLLINGNCYIRVIRANKDPQNGMDSSGRPTQLVVMDPEEVSVGSNSFGIPQYNHDTYGQMVAENVIHIRDLNVFTAQGYSRTLLASEIIGAKLAADALMAKTFRTGINVNYAVSTDATIPPDQHEAVQKALGEAFNNQGDGSNVMLLEGGAALSSVKGATPADADLRALRQELKNEIAGVFRVPSFMVGGTGNVRYNNVRQQLSSFHRDTLQPIITNIEEAITIKLLDGVKDKVVIDVTDFIKGDIESQSKYAGDLVTRGIMTPNEARAYLEMGPHDSETADQLIEPNSTSSETTTETVEGPSTGGDDGPQGGENEDS